MEAIILAGGFGTRLKNVIKDVPKPMAPIQGKPFLEYLLCQLKQFSISNIIMCTGYKHEVVEAYFGTQFKGIPISYSVEREPLGTGGAIMHAFSYINEESFLVLNGDTFFKVDIEYLIKFHIKNNSDCTIALKKITNSDRYGTVKCQNNRIVAFEEKQFREESTINGGLYYINKSTLSKVNPLNKFSLEKDFFEKYVNDFSMYGFLFNEYFIDIGIPEDYERAQKELPELCRKYA